MLSDPETRKRYDWLLSQGEVEYNERLDWSGFEGGKASRHWRPRSYEDYEAQLKQMEDDEFFAFVVSMVGVRWTLSPRVLLLCTGTASSCFLRVWRRRRQWPLFLCCTLPKRVGTSTSASYQPKRSCVRSRKWSKRSSNSSLSSDRSNRRKRRQKLPSAVPNAKVCSIHSLLCCLGCVSLSALPLSHRCAAAEKEKAKERGEGEPAFNPLKCELCGNKYKSQAQLDTHYQSAAHKKAAKEAERLKAKEKGKPKKDKAPAPAPAAAPAAADDEPDSYV